MKRTSIAAIVMAVVAATGVFAEDGELNAPESPIVIRPVAETGVVKVLTHRIQIGEGTDGFDYVRQGGQEILFPFSRLGVEADLGQSRRHTLIFLYQPLTVRTQTEVETDNYVDPFDQTDTLVNPGLLTIDDAQFADGTPLDITYGFDFWRLSYLFNIVDSPSATVSAGLSFQLRNASIRFESSDGDDIVVTQDLGPVPILKARASYRAPSGVFFGLEADGFYASSAFFNGVDYPFTGWIYDVSVRGGTRVRRGLDAFLNLRLLGGGSDGTARSDTRLWTESADAGAGRFNTNVLTALTVTLGARVY